LPESEVIESNLVTRLDPAIGEASTGIGFVLSELVRHSLRAGVAEIDQSLQTLASEKVDMAVAGKMAEVTDAAEQVSRQVSENAVRQVAEKTDQVAARAAQIAVEAEQERSRTNDLAAKTERVAAQASQTAEHLSQSINSAVERFSAELGETQRRSEQLDSTLQLLREKAKHSWQKVGMELHSLKGTNGQLNQQLLAAQKLLKDAEHRLTTIEGALTECQQRLDSALARCESQEKRLADLERPRGINALLQRLRGKSPPALPSSSPVNETPQDGEPNASA